MSELVVERLVKRFGGLVATDHLDLAVARGEIHAIIGPNGAGKTTLINQLSGEFFPDEGRIIFDGVEITREPANSRSLRGIGRSYQITSVFPEFSALENVMLAVQAHSGSSFRFWQPVHADSELFEPARAMLDQVGLGGRAATPVAVMAHGERRQLELAMTIATRPKLLLLDEPMAGMSHHESEGMVKLLLGLKGAYTIVLVEHDMDAVFKLADRITVLVYGRPIACGSPHEIRNNQEVRDAYLGDQTEAI
jgi:branched-chain amino acid transport system ATP-binding protein